MVKDIRHKELRDLVWLMKYIRIKFLTKVNICKYYQIVGLKYKNNPTI